MAMTIVEKILARAGGVPNVSPGDFVVVNVDTAVLFDNNFSTLYWRDVLKVADPEKIVVAVPNVTPAATELISGSIDSIVYLTIEPNAAAHLYAEFPTVSEEEVIDILRQRSAALSPVTVL